jgi:hypothetical protein
VRGKFDDLVAGVRVGGWKCVTTAWSIAPPRAATVGQRRVPRLEAVAPVSARAIARPSGPLSRTTPIPPRPGGVAIATIVSSVENIGARRRDYEIGSTIRLNLKSPISDP